MPSSTNYSDLRAALQCGNQRCPCHNERGLVHCPAHPDDNPSLSLTQRNGRLLWHCFAGCDQDQVLAALQAKGLIGAREKEGLTLAQLAEYKKLPISFLQKWGLQEVRGKTGAPAVAIPYYDAQGRRIAWRYRRAMAGPGRFAWAKGARVSPYGIHLLDRIRAAGRVLWVEGESDTWTGWFYNEPTLGIPGKATWHSEWAQYTAGIENYVWQEPDADDLVKRMALDIPNLRVIRSGQFKDLSEAHLWGEDIPNLLKTLREQATPPPRQEIKLDSMSGDYGHAQELAKLFDGQFRWATHRGAWMWWTGGVWRKVEEEFVVNFAARALMQEYSGRLMGTTEKTAVKELLGKIKDTCSFYKMKAALSFLKGQEGILTESHEWDADPWLLNVANGTLDLRSGVLRPHDPIDLLTKQAPVTYDPGARSEHWQRHIERFLPEPAVRRQVQRDLGLALVGATLEESLAIWYGIGANGKTTTARVLMRILGDYADRAAPDLLMQSKYEHHPTGIADLAGLRLVFSIEVDQGKHLAEAIVKDLTGGDRKKARFMRQDYFSFEQTFSIVLIVNHKPIVTGTDNAIWRRIKLIPWQYCIPESERRPQEEVVDELAKEGSAILNWLLEGLRDWQNDRMWLAEEVRAASEAYRAEMDILTEFIEARCVLNPRAIVLAKELYDAYVAWCESEHEKPLSKRSFTQRLHERGIASIRVGHSSQRAYRGIGLVVAEVNEF